MDESGIPDKIVAACEEAAQRDPRKFKYGVYAGDSWTGGAYTFSWFTDVRGLVHFLTDLAPGLYIDPKDEPEDYVACRDQLRELLEGVDTIAKFDEVLIDSLNEAMDDQSIIWIGTFQDLCKGKSQWCRELRQEFRTLEDDEDGDPSDGPIKTSEVDAFVDMLEGYGQ